MQEPEDQQQTYFRERTTTSRPPISSSLMSQTEYNNHSSWQPDLTPSTISTASPFQDSHQNDNLPHLNMYQTGAQFDIERVVAESGVPPSTLRVWEYRYGIPARTGEQSNRLYSWRDIAVVRWVRGRIISGLSTRQAMVELATYEPAYAFSRGLSPQVLAMPPQRDLQEFREPLIRAIVSKDEKTTEKLLTDAFAIHPAEFVCQQLLQPILIQLISLRQRGKLPFEIEVFCIQMVQAQTVYLIEALVPPKEAQQYLLSLITRVTKASEASSQVKQEQAPTAYLGQLEGPLLDAFRRLDEKTAQHILDQAFLDYSVEDVCLNLLQAVLYHIGTLWEEKHISSMVEHFATSLIRTRLSSIFQSTPDLNQGPVILIGCAPRETHEIGALMLALFCRRAGLRVSYFGQMVETQGLLQEIQNMRPGVVCLSAMTRPRVRDLEIISRAIDRLNPPKPVFCYGGGVFARNTNLGRKIKGFYLGNDATQAVQYLQRVARLQE